VQQPFYAELTAFMSSGPIVALELVGNGAIAKWRALIGPTNTFKAREEAPSCLRAQFGSDATRNATHGSDSVASAERELGFFFGEPARLAGTAKFSNCTLALVKPHAVKEGLTGQIVDALASEGFEVSALQQFSLSRVNAGEFLEVYKAVMADFSRLEEELSNGPCVAIEVRGEQAVQAVREVAGPHDPELARVLRPKTLRAKFGRDKVQNALHCTDLPEDGQLEVEYFFRIMQ
jgi:nucleoside-diphosphate kinase